MTTKIIQVKQIDINSGVRKKAQYCPIARALKRHGFKHVSVGFVYMTYVSNTVYYSVTLPKRVRTFINRFDTGRPVKPFSFKIEVRDEFRVNS